MRDDGSEFHSSAWSLKLNCLLFNVCAADLKYISETEPAISLFKSFQYQVGLVEQPRLIVTV